MHADAEAGDGLCRRHKLTGHKPDAAPRCAAPSGEPRESERAVYYTCLRDVLVTADKISRTVGEFQRSLVRYAIGERCEECVKIPRKVSVIRIPAICTQIFGASFEVVLML